LFDGAAYNGKAGSSKEKTHIKIDILDKLMSLPEVEAEEENTHMRILEEKANNKFFN